MDCEWKLLLRCSEVAEGKRPVEMLSQVVQRDRSRPYVTSCVADFDFNENDSHPFASPLSPCFFQFRKMKLKFNG
jgi:hypothetical protein